MPSPLVRKLRIQPGQRVLILNAPPGYVSSLGELPEGVVVSDRPEGKFDFVHLFVKDSADYEALSSSAVRAVTYDGLLWISYPKRSAKVQTDLTRDMLWELTSDTGLRPVSQVSVDDVWSAIRLRPHERVAG